MKIVARTLVVSLFLFLCIPGVLARQQLVPFEQEGKWGYQDAQGKIAIAPIFIAAHDFSPEGIAAVVDDAGWAYINRRGTIVVRPFLFDNGPDPFQEGLARFTHEGKFGFFDRRGKVVIEPKFDFAAPFHEGLAAFCKGCTKNMTGEHSFWEGGKWGYINRRGNIAIAAHFDSVKNFDKGRAQVTREGKLIYINKKGMPLTDSQEKVSMLPDDTHKDAGVLREYYCTWCRHNGAIAEEIQAQHIPFFTWLGCK